MIEKKLNQNQKKAAEYMGEALCVLASAGCGKTTVLVAHYLALLQKKKLRPSQIVVTTFSEKSAADIKQKILKELETAADELLIEEFLQAPISTLHSLAGRILRDSSLLLGLDPHFEILDENEAAYLKTQSLQEVMKRLLDSSSPSIHLLVKAYGWKRSENELFHMLQNWPEWKSVFEGEKDDNPLKNAFQEVFLEILSDYESHKKNREVLDFNDLEERAIKLLQKHPWVIKHYQKQWKAFLIDEFQDTSIRQDILLSLLLNISLQNELLSSTHLAIVGDPKQSIYGFRGAKSHIFEKYQSMIEKKGGISVLLDENYRSPRSVLQFVNQLFAPVFKNYSSLVGPSDLPSALEILQQEKSGEKSKIEEIRKEEAEKISLHIQKLIREGSHPKDIYLLFRSSTSMSIYLKALRNKSIPVFIKSGESLLERQEIQDLLHAMRVLLNPQDKLSWIGLLRSPAFSISDEKLLEYSLDHSQKADWGKIHPLAEKLLLQNRHISPTQFLEWWFEQTQIITLYSSEASLSLKAQNILQFYNLSFNWETEHSTSLEEFLREMELLLEEKIEVNALSDQLGTGNSITFMTIHQSKGLDLPIVLLPDLKPGKNNSESRSLVCKSENTWGIRIPDLKPGLKKSLKASEEYDENLKKIYFQQEEEENRIFYVATTRSTQKLILGFLPEAPEKIKEDFPINARNRLSEVAQNFPSTHWIKPESSPEKTSSQKPLFYQIEKPLHFAQNRLLHFAVTQLETFMHSPDEYKERFVYNISAESLTPRQRNRNKDHLSALERGQIIHEALCLYSDQHNKLSPHEMIHNLAAKHHLASSLDDTLHSLEKTFEESTSHPSLQKILRADEGYSEIAFRLRLEPYVIQGAMDRLIREGHEWKVVDYKTHSASSSSLPGSEEFEFQLKTYCLAASKMLKQGVHKAQVYFVLSHQTHDYFFPENELLKHEETLRNLMQEINKMV